MMINRRLIGMVPESMPHIAKTVLFQWIGLMSNVVAMYALGALIAEFSGGAARSATIVSAIAIALLCALVRFGSVRLSFRESHLASRPIKHVLREKVYQKLLRLGVGYASQIPTAEVVQATVEGVDQLETYFGSYLPQFFYAMLAPVTLFFALSRVSPSIAAALLACVPLIPVSIVVIQRVAKKLLAKYWGQYAKLGDSFLENLQGLTTLKLFGADGERHKQMNVEAERFRVVTMQVLKMQLNSVTVLDLVAYGGAALGVLLAVSQLALGRIDLGGCFAIVMLSAEFFLPLRLLGSYFHVAMNGMSASERIFRLLDLPEEAERTSQPGRQNGVCLNDMSFRYGDAQYALRNVSFSITGAGLYGIVGASGSGKSTLASLLGGYLGGYEGSVRIGGVALNELSRDALHRFVTIVGHNSYIFQGTIAENLRMGRPEADDEALWRVLARVNLSGFLRDNGGLGFALTERGTNLSGGQRQRLALARALLMDSPVYVLDEATSNIDPESEANILAEAHTLAQSKIVLFISHRLSSVRQADRVFVLEHGLLCESGQHDALVAKGGVYARLWQAQAALESFAQEAAV